MNRDAIAHPREKTTALSWRRIFLPTEHGSWALVFEPVALGLLVAPSISGLFLGLGVTVGFLSRRPMQLGWSQKTLDLTTRYIARRSARALWTFAAIFLGAAIYRSPFNTVIPLGIAVPLLLLFAWFDRLGRARHLIAELASTAACSLLPVAMALSDGFANRDAVALGIANLARAWPTLLVVRTWLRRSRGETQSFVPALLAQLLAPAFLAVLAQSDVLPWPVVAINALLSVRALVLFSLPPKHFSAKQLGIFEAIGGVLYVASLALAYAGHQSGSR
jgi:hypothetical protein